MDLPLQLQIRTETFQPYRDLTSQRNTLASVLQLQENVTLMSSRTGSTVTTAVLSVRLQ